VLGDPRSKRLGPMLPTHPRCCRRIPDAADASQGHARLAGRRIFQVEGRRRVSEA
jgi:hypothetical protein